MVDLCPERPSRTDDQSQYHSIIATGERSMKILAVKTTVVNVPFVAPLRWSGGVEDGWSRCIVEMTTDMGVVGLGETLGGDVTKLLIDTNVAPMFLGENPHNLEKILARTLFVPFYYGKAGLCAIAAL